MVFWEPLYYNFHKLFFSSNPAWPHTVWAIDETDAKRGHVSPPHNRPFSPARPSIISQWPAASISCLLLLFTRRLQPQWPSTENQMTPPKKDISSHHSSAKLLQRFSPAGWRKQHYLPMDCGHLRIRPCSSLWFSLSRGYSLFQTLTPASFRSHRSTPGVWLLDFSLHSGLNLNATSSKKASSDYPSQWNILSPNHSVTTAPKVAQGATEHFQFVGKNDMWVLSDTGTKIRTHVYE